MSGGRPLGWLHGTKNEKVLKSNSLATIHEGWGEGEIG
jgi:hypothetical protein